MAKTHICKEVRSGKVSRFDNQSLSLPKVFGTSRGIQMVFGDNLSCIEVENLGGR